MDYLPYLLLFVILCVLLFLFLRRPQEARGEVEEVRVVHHQPQNPHAWTLCAIKTKGQNADGSSRPFLIETLKPLELVTLQYNLDEHCYEVQNRAYQTLGYLPHNSTDRVRLYQAAGRISRVLVKQKSGSADYPKLVLEIEVKP